MIELLVRLQKEKNISMLFICHDLALIRSFAHQIAVMYLGNIVEVIPGEDVTEYAVHPYTQALLSAIPIPDPKVPMNRITMKGEITSPINPEKGCRFAKRCPYATDACRQQDMVLTEQEPGHFVTCLRVQRGEI